MRPFSREFSFDKVEFFVNSFDKIEKIMIVREEALILAEISKIHQFFTIFLIITNLRFLYFTAKPIRAGHHPSGIPTGPVGIRGGGGPRPPVVKALTEADLLSRSHQN